MRMISAILALALVGCGAAATDGTPGAATAASTLREPDVRYEPTPQPIVEQMLRLANVQPGDVVYDLGSGDGRIPITAARTLGVHGVGIDIDPIRVGEAKANARAAGVTSRATFRNEDLFVAKSAMRPW